MAVTNEELVVKINELEDQLKKAEDALNAAELRAAVASMDPDDGAAFEALSETEKAEFAKANEEERETLLAKSASRIEKANALPEAVQKQLSEIQKKLDDAESRATAAETVAKAERDRAHLQELSKRAETDFANLPGTPEEKGKILKSLESLPEEEREPVLQILRAGNEAMKATMAPVGKNSTTSVGGAWGKIESLAKSLVSPTLTKEKAVAKVIEDNPELYDAYLAEKP